MMHSPQHEWNCSMCHHFHHDKGCCPECDGPPRDPMTWFEFLLSLAILCTSACVVVLIAVSGYRYIFG